jgi:hypothetical protein
LIIVDVLRTDNDDEEEEEVKDDNEGTLGL